MTFKGFGVGIAKGMALTFRHFFRPAITVQYPEEGLVPSRRTRGNEFFWWSGRCTGCATCAKACPQGNIQIVTSRESDNSYFVEKFEIDRGRCMFCGLCVEACPFGALYMGRSYEEARYRRRELIADKFQLMSAERKPSAYAHPGLEPAMPVQTIMLIPKKGKR